MTVQVPPWQMRPLAIERYRRLGAQTIGDSSRWLLASIVDAQAAMWDGVELVGRVQDDGRDGWVVALDPATCPRRWLPCAAQLGGVTIDPVSVAPDAPPEFVAAERARAVERPALYTGLTRTILSAIRRYLLPAAGPGAVIWRPRFDPDSPTADSAYHLTVVVRRSAVRPDELDGDDAPRLLAAFLDALPAGLIGHLRISDERDWQEVYDTWPTWQGAEGDNTDWADVLTP